MVFTSVLQKGPNPKDEGLNLSQPQSQPMGGAPVPWDPKTVLKPWPSEASEARAFGFGDVSFGGFAALSSDIRLPRRGDRRPSVGRFFVFFFSGGSDGDFSVCLNHECSRFHVYRFLRGFINQANGRTPPILGTSPEKHTALINTRSRLDLRKKQLSPFWLWLIVGGWLMFKICASPI